MLGVAAADGGDRAGDLGTRQTGSAGRWRIGAGALGEVRTIDTCCSQLDQELAWLGLGYRTSPVGTSTAGPPGLPISTQVMVAGSPHMVGLSKRWEQC